LVPGRRRELERSADLDRARRGRNRDRGDRRLRATAAIAPTAVASTAAVATAGALVTAPDALRADHQVVDVALLLARGAVVPVVLQEQRVDAVGAVVAHPVQVRGARLEIAVDPELEDTVALAGIVHPDPRLDAIPLAHVRGIEERRLADLRPEPAGVGEVVVLGRAYAPLRIRPRRRVEDQVVVPSAAAPDGRDERRRPGRTGEDNCPGQLVAAAARPPRLVAQIEAPVGLPVVGRTAG